MYISECQETLDCPLKSHPQMKDFFCLTHVPGQKGLHLQIKSCEFYVAKNIALSKQ